MNAPADVITDAVGTSRPRLEGPEKVSGRARYAADHPMHDLAFGVVVTSPVARGRIRDIDASAVLTMPGVLGVLDHRNAPRLDPQASGFFGPDGSMQLLQSDSIPHAGRAVALVVAQTPHEAQAAADALAVTCDAHPHDTTFTADHPAGRAALTVLGEDANVGDVDAELASSPVVVDERYFTPEEHCSAMEPHAATAWWDGGRLQAFDSNQGAFDVARTLASLFSLELDQVRVRSEHVGGGFGSKGLLGPQLILATMGSMAFGRPVRVTLTRRQVFLMIGMRPATEQRVRLGADTDGSLRAIDHQAAFEISPLAEWVENCPEGSKVLYATRAIRTRITAVPLDLTPPGPMRGPGLTPGSFALESAMDELAERLGIDPLELRLRNEPAVGPVSGLPYGSRNLAACLREGARRFGWHSRDPRPRRRREGHLLVGTGLAATAFGSSAFPSTASITAETDGSYTVRIAASDIGTGSRTALVAIAAEALRVGTERIRIRIADSDLGPAWSASGSRGTPSWAWAINEAATRLREQPHDPTRPVTVTVDTAELFTGRFVREVHAYSAIFAEVTVDPATGEVRTRRLLGMFAIGRVVNPLLARSQVIGGMIMGLGMALHEEGVRDPVSGRQVNADFAGYHIPAHADVPDIEADFVPEYEPDEPSGVKGAGEIGTVGTAAAIANAVWHATGLRHRVLPIRLDRVVEEMA
ncbi:xanthine dehydrogenase family protein molybdopterin-binding subunit [Sphaerisporangium album]|uniref:Xanthine dehydrogenase family protein molybdopterin-binding subunit n=1 Tax=Sphaerisporangium album TaxID=509200 RepID=A0A367FS18_9ACTN|nr:xanthine dehydrogenase family protein molybdopterin-binding subunit [Sphaerisporangium album]RCG33223.1 xanthine dehydrogenase family protein molybdopterin-binding subunit [Sphaerisporangium album]